MEGTTVNVLIGLIMFVIGLAHVINPTFFWYISNGWKFKNAEPSDLALFMGRVGGVITMIIAIFVMTGAIGFRAR
jgi:hypothetical protein